MTKNCTVAIVGGDERSLYAAQFLADAGARIAMYASEETEVGCCYCFENIQCSAPYLLDEAIRGANALLLPIPFSRDGQKVFAPFSKKAPDFGELSDALHKVCAKKENRPLIFGGNLPPELFDGFSCHDLLKDEAFTDANAYATAENAVALAILNDPGILRECAVSVLGYGRIGGYLTDLLLKLGAQVTVYARNAFAREQAEKKGATALDFNCFYEHAPFYRILFGTVPAPVVNAADAERISPDALYMELASAPYGMTKDARRVLKCKYLPAPGLPGRYSPSFSGRIIARYIINQV